MSRGHNFTHCQYCNREYVCGDCITTNCEMGHGKRKCEHYQAYIRQERSAATRMLEIAKDISKTGQQRGGARMLAGVAWDNVCKELTDSELADALKHKVWSDMELGTEKIALLEQAIDRLEGKCANK
jgi:hypothetical protein